MQEISAADAAAKLAADPENTVLLDVREAMELEIAALEGAIHVPMAETPARLNDLDPEKTIICMCHHGGRSAQVAAFLQSRGYRKVINMSGGIEAWSLSVDAEIPRY